MAPLLHGIKDSIFIHHTSMFRSSRLDMRGKHILARLGKHETPELNHRASHMALWLGNVPFHQFPDLAISFGLTPPTQPFEHCVMFSGHLEF